MRPFIVHIYFYFISDVYANMVSKKIVIWLSTLLEHY